MEKITPAAWRQLAFPTPIDLQRDGRDNQNKSENDDWPPAFQNMRTVEAAVSAANHWQPDAAICSGRANPKKFKIF
jgi:hypothetical protein